jgi:hypothetical protein
LLKEGGKKMEGGWIAHSSKWRDDGSVFVDVHLLSSESVITNGPMQYHIVIYSEIVK